MGEEKKFVTQEEVDKYFKKWKETGEKLEKVIEKLDKTAAEKVELVARIKKLEEEKTKVPLPDDEKPLSEVYTVDNPPKTEDEWNDLYDENPSYAQDLKEKVRSKLTEWQKERQRCLQVLQEKHPDLYKRDENGNFIRDAHGNLIFDHESEKGKIWNRIAGRDPKILESASAPEIVMKAMELELKEGQEAKVKAELEEKKRKEEEERKKKAEAAALAGGGDTPPPPDDEKIEIKYTSEEEKRHVQRMIASGVYKDEKDYFKTLRKGPEIPSGRGGF